MISIFNIYKNFALLQLKLYVSTFILFSVVCGDTRSIQPLANTEATLKCMVSTSFVIIFYHNSVGRFFVIFQIVNSSAMLLNSITTTKK